MPQNTYEFYTTLPPFWDGMKKELALAKKTIDLEQYNFGVDKISTEFLDLLRQKNKEGVKIRMHLDTVGSGQMYLSNIPETLRKEGIEIKFFNPISAWRIHNFTSWVFRNHQKVLVIDKLVGFTGGSGIGDHMINWRDTNAKVSGPIVDELLSSFEEMWKIGGEVTLSSRIKLFRKGFKRNLFITNAPYFRKRFLYYTFIDKLRLAKKSILLTTPYFIPDRRLTRVLKLAVKRGVEVKVIVPAVEDVPFVHPASYSMYTSLLKRGVRIFRYQGLFHHGKTGIVDDEWATMGSFNLDNLSFLYNFEVNIVSIEKEFVKNVLDQFTEDMSHCREVLLEEWEKRPFIQKFKEFWIGLIRGFL